MKNFAARVLQTSCTNYSYRWHNKNKATVADKNADLFFSYPTKSSYPLADGEAKIILDKKTINDLCTPAVKIWYKDGENDPNISLIKVCPDTAYYRDTDGNLMINSLKMIASVATGTNLLTNNQGALSL